MNVYIDPTSWRYLDDALFQEDEKDTEDDFHRIYRYLRGYCQERGITFHTIDLYDKSKKSPDDVYVSLEHKNFVRRLYWHFRKDRRYPVAVNLKHFRKRMLFQGEPPVADPASYQNIKGLLKIYDKVYFPFKSGDPRIGFYQMSFSRDAIPAYRENTDRKFLTMINSNISPYPLKRILLLLVSGGGFKYLGYKELLSERLRAIEFFSRTGEIDLYGYGWNKPLPFPYRFYKKSVQKAYNGSVPSKLRKLSEYNFSIVLENCALPSHISEKIFDCFYAGTVPIYLGAPDIQGYIPKDCFIDMREFKNYEELKGFLRALPKDEIKRYRANALAFLQSDKMKPFTQEYLAEFFVKAVTNNQ